MSPVVVCAAPLAAALLLSAVPLRAGDIYDEAPLHYSRRTSRDTVSGWMETLATGRPAFDRRDVKSFLASVLRELAVPAASQILVFSHTSLQNSLISPETPRALYFSDDHYVGWVQGGDIELMDFDVRKGLTFYRLSVPGPTRPAAPEVSPGTNCLACHTGHSENPFPGLLAFSVATRSDGRQNLSVPSYEVDDRTPIERRWGGWYVTGHVAGSPHRGNSHLSLKAEATAPPNVNLGTPANLDAVIATAPYLRNRSDVVALLVFEHQIRAHNRLLAAYGRSRIALFRDDGYLVGEPLSARTEEALDAEADHLLEAMLFKDEAPLAGRAIRGDPEFVKAFTANARRDPAGRSLKDFDLTTRLFRYRCSYMIYSRTFASLPEALRTRFWERLARVLAESAGTGRFGFLDAGERAAIREIITETVPNLPANWKGGPAGQG